VEYRQFPQVVRLEALQEAKKKDLPEDHAHVAKITSFKHVSRNMNVVAHLLAHLSEHLVCNFCFVVIMDVIQAELQDDVV
jgi:hypothetical protein